MRKLIVYTLDGEIVANKVGPQWSLEAYMADSEELCLLTDTEINPASYYVDNGQLVEKPERPSPEHTFDYAAKQWVYDLTGHRDAKWTEVKSARTEEELSTFVWNDHSFDCDEVSQRRIQGAVHLASMDTSTVTEWTLADNTTQTFNAADLQEIGKALSDHVKQCHDRGRILRQQIQAATTQEELEAIAW